MDYLQLQVTIDIKSLTMSVAGRGITTQVVAARGRQRKTISGSLNDGKALFNSPIEYLCFVALGDEARESVKASVYMETTKGKRKGGTFELPVGAWFLQGSFWSGDIPLEGCPDKKAKVEVESKIEVKRRLSESEYK